LPGSSHTCTMFVSGLYKPGPDLAVGLKVFASKETPDRSLLKSALSTSGEAIGLFLTELIAGKPKRRGLKKGWIAHLSYFIAHESHHRGSILLTLKQSGHALDQDTRYAIWNWDKM
jgi:DinB family protein